MEFFYHMLKGTPVWVYVLLVFLVIRGIKARRPATVTLARLAVIPALFLCWDIYDLLLYRHLTAAALLMWLAGLAAGAALGYRLVDAAAVVRAPQPGAIHRPADYSSLPLILVAFLIKYALGVTAARHPELLLQPGVNALAIVSGGLFVGTFIGKFSRYISCWRRNQPARQA